MMRPQLNNVFERAVSGDRLGLLMILVALLVAIALIVTSARQLIRHR
jgi:hypothetical protein